MRQGRDDKRGQHLRFILGEFAARYTRALDRRNDLVGDERFLFAVTLDDESRLAALVPSSLVISLYLV